MRLPKYVIFDLTTGKAEDYPISEKYFRDYIGGKCLGARLLLDLMPKNTDALAPEAVMIINTSPLNGTGAPSTSRYNMSFKNVMTGGVASSNCGGQFGTMLKRAGYDGLILKGKAEKPVTIEIIDGEFSVSDASHLWGMNAEEV
ncbi:MAG: aldehyde:ferredoxin oxidoreductase, partial [Oscillospiraceae bacterium]|nr:aldehyde:ferredoxin oxidoreductase [Oscillospiraceae bacterium]